MDAIREHRTRTSKQPRPSKIGQPRPAGYLPTLDGWRALAIAGVLACHGGHALFHASGPMANAVLYRLTRYGDRGVYLFFAISGLLICSRLIEEDRWRGSISLWGFYLRRMFRILPAYLVYLAVVGLCAALGLLAINPMEWLSCIAFVRNYLFPQELGGWFTGHFWSLAVEEHFYLLWPGLLVLVGCRRGKWLAIALALTLTVWRAWDFRYQTMQRLLPGVGFEWRSDIRLDGLLWGCAVAFILVENQAALRRWLTPSIWVALIGACLASVAFKPPLWQMVQAVTIPLILVRTVLDPAGLLGRFLEWDPIRWVGRISYSLYLWQQLFLVAHGVHRTLGWLQEWPINLLAMFACATLSYYFIERPMIKIGHSLAVPATPGRC